MSPNLQPGRAGQWVPGLPSLRSVARDDVAFDDGFGFIIAMGGYVYILASRKHGTLYTGVTSNLEGRVWEHREDITGGFTKRYDVKRLVWYRDYSDIRDAIDDEKRIKRWRRKWKLELIEAINPQWRDLYEDLAK